jgi:Cu/Ag efflux protein CusF
MSFTIASAEQSAGTLKLTASSAADLAKFKEGDQIALEIAPDTGAQGMSSAAPKLITATVSSVDNSAKTVTVKPNNPDWAMLKSGGKVNLMHSAAGSGTQGLGQPAQRSTPSTSPSPSPSTSPGSTPAPSQR